MATTKTDNEEGIIDVLLATEIAPEPDEPGPDELDIIDTEVGELPKSRHSKPETSPVDTDTVRLYLREIGRIPLLNQVQEIELSRQIQRLIALEAAHMTLVNQHDHVPSDAEWAASVGLTEPQLKQALRQGRRAKDKMVQSNLRLVVSIAKRHQNRGMPLQDLIQEGSLGLIRGAEKFNAEKGYKFSTYATWWIRQAITRAIAEKSRTIRLPVHLYETLNRIKRTTMLLSQELGRKPTEEEIATRMEMTVDKLRFIAKSAQPTRSLDQPISTNRHNGEDGSTLGDFIDSPEVAEPGVDVDRQLLKTDLESVLNTLSERERDIVRMRYGLDDGRPKTLEEIGCVFNLTRERIRQIEGKAIRKLRKPQVTRQLQDHLGK